VKLIVFRGKKAEKVRCDLDVKIKRQTKVSKNIACLSPYSNFIYVATDITGTGLRSLSYFDRVKGEYRKLYYDYQSKKFGEAREKDPTLDSNSFLDISDRPQFSFKEEPLKDRLRAVIPYWGILIFFNIIFFICAFVKFIRYDVR